MISRVIFNTTLKVYMLLSEWVIIQGLDAV